MGWFDNIGKGLGEGFYWVASTTGLVSDETIIKAANKVEANPYVQGYHTGVTQIVEKGELVGGTVTMATTTAGVVQGEILTPTGQAIGEGVHYVSAQMGDEEMDWAFGENSVIKKEAHKLADAGAFVKDNPVEAAKLAAQNVVIDGPGSILSIPGHAADLVNSAVNYTTGYGYQGSAAHWLSDGWSNGFEIGGQRYGGARKLQEAFGFKPVEATSEAAQTVADLYKAAPGFAVTSTREAFAGANKWLTIPALLGSAKPDAAPENKEEGPSKLNQQFNGAAENTFWSNVFNIIEGVFKYVKDTALSIAGTVSSYFNKAAASDATASVMEPHKENFTPMAQAARAREQAAAAPNSRDQRNTPSMHLGL